MHSHTVADIDLKPSQEGRGESISGHRGVSGVGGAKGAWQDEV